MFAGVALLLGLAAYAAVERDWPWLLPFTIPAGYLAHLLWLLDRPWSGRSLQVVATPAIGLLVMLGYLLINAMGSLRRHDRSEEEPATVVAVLLNCGVGYGLFVLATIGAAPAWFAPAHVIAATGSWRWLWRSGGAKPAGSRRSSMR